MTPRAVHTTIRHLSAVISRGESEMRQNDSKISSAYYYTPKLTDADIAKLRKQNAVIDEKLQPVRAALAALARCVGDGSI